MKKIFVSGGAGYIGSHTVKQLLEQGYEVTVFDNLSNSTMTNLERVQAMTGKVVEFIKGDLLNYSEIANALRPEHEAVIHFAALKSVVDSQSTPLKYYENNVTGTINLLKAMGEKGVKNIIFSSTGAVYGQPDTLPIGEDIKMSPISVYAKTKAMMENIFEDMQVNGLNSVRLRYFNVAGAEKSGKIGEDPSAMGNLIPRVFANLVGKHDLVIYGNTFPTADGTQVRDYIHVVDLAAAHVKALAYIETHKGSVAINLGTGAGTTVLQIVNEVARVTGKNVAYTFGPAREGENIEVYAKCDLAKQLLDWQAESDYHQIIEDSWNWYKTCTEYKEIA